MRLAVVERQPGAAPAALEWRLLITRRMGQVTTETRTKKHTPKREAGDADPPAIMSTSESIARVADYIREQPFQAVGMALGIGYVARILFRGPFATLAVLGGVGYLGARLAVK
jgi:hypothetical protein